MQLFQSNKHEPLTNTAWQIEVAEQAKHNIVQGCLSAFAGDDLWPLHPDLRESYKLSSPIGGVWFGAAGSMMALHELVQLDATLPQHDFSPYLDDLWPAQQINLQELDAWLPLDTKSPGYLLGEAGINFTAYRISGDEKYAQRLLHNLQCNISNPVLELMWASSGTMLVACFMHAHTHDNAWIDVFKQSADQLFATWQYNNDLDCYVWQQSMYGFNSYITSLVHGYAGNVFALMKGYAWLEPEQQSQLVERALHTFKRTALVSEKHANWQPCLTPAWPNWDLPLLQLCAGAPGMIFAYADFWQYMNDESKTLMQKAAQLIWDAGPIVKPWGICHGNAGNGWAMLKMAKLTNDQSWVDKAQAFAMHAIEQMQAKHTEFDQYRTDFWCGDLGLAVYLQALLDGTDQLFSLDYA